MGADVHLEGAQRAVSLVTHLAGELLLDMLEAVELAVFGQTAERGVRLVAGLAVVAGWRGDSRGGRHGGGGVQVG